MADRLSLFPDDQHPDRLSLFEHDPQPSDGSGELFAVGRCPVCGRGFEVDVPSDGVCLRCSDAGHEAPTLIEENN